MSLELDIHAEWYKKDLLKTTVRRGTSLIIPVHLYRLHVRAPFTYVSDDERRTTTITIPSTNGFLYHGPISQSEGIDPDILLAFGIAVPREALRPPYTFFERFVEGPNGTIAIHDRARGTLTIDGIAAYSPTFMARWSS